MHYTYEYGEDLFLEPLTFYRDLRVRDEFKIQCFVTNSHSFYTTSNLNDTWQRIYFVEEHGNISISNVLWTGQVPPNDFDTIYCRIRSLKY